MIKLQTERLIIRDPVLTELDDWHHLLSDSKVMHYLDDIQTHNKDESLKNLEEAVREAQSPNRTKYFFAVEHKESGQFIGSIGYTVTRATPLGKFVGVGYFISTEHQGKGYVTEAMKELIRFAFEENNVFRIETGCLAENIASERVMQKCGMIKEAERRQYQWHNGQIKDRVEYRLLKDEWLTAKQYQDKNFWQTLDTLIKESEIKIDRPKGSPHPRYPDNIHPLDYGFLDNTASMDGDGIDLWLGSDPARKLDAVMIVVDLKNRDSEIKLLIGCTEEEKAKVYEEHNKTEFMKGMLVGRRV